MLKWVFLRVNVERVLEGNSRALLMDDFLVVVDVVDEF